MPKVTIDGIEIEVEDGLNLIQAASKAGIEIPHFCYHPALSIVAQCRQCLVEVEGVPKVLPACNTFVRDGLEIKTDTEKALKAREATLEFTLINHPLDCPICDKGGECPLQLTTFKHGPGGSRFGGPENKKVRQKYYLSDRILYDPNRCIMCTRCVRFTDEVTGTSELGTSGRGFRKKISVFPGKELNNELAGNVIDICPVGALLNKDTLHEERVWYWEFTDSVCSLCSNGCNITVGVDPRKGRVARIRPRVNDEVNDFWICDRGRYEYKEVQEKLRLNDPISKTSGAYEITSWDDATYEFHHEFTKINNEFTSKVGVVGSANMTNEEIFLLSRLTSKIKTAEFTASLGTKNIEKKFGILSNDSYPNSRGIRNFKIADEPNDIKSTIESIMKGNINMLIVVNEDLFNITPEDRHEELRKALENIRYLTVIDYKLTETSRYADLILPGASPYEKDGTFTNDQGRIQKINKAINPPGNAKPQWEILCMLGKKFDHMLFDFGSPSQIMDSISKRYDSYDHISYDRIGVMGSAEVN